MKIHDYFKIDLMDDARKYILDEAQKCYWDWKTNLKKHYQEKVGTPTLTPLGVMTIGSAAIIAMSHRHLR